MKIVVCTGGFDPLHTGHIQYLTEAANFGDMLIVGLNSDAWLEKKKGRAFMPWAERAAVLRAMRVVTRVESFADDDIGSARNLLIQIKRQFPYADIIFANGGDRTENNIPEMDVPGIDFVFGIGGFTKSNSSSWILDEWKAPKTERPWGYYRVLHEVPGTKVKELTINPGQSLSMQRHASRAEYWHVSHGACDVFSMMPNGYALPVVLLSEHMNYHVPTGQWHKLTNPYEVPCKIVEIQYGAACTEEDIERR
jgi:D-beta-D-heptose 7-phosphate kinase/D-beta-D-heptose 1-phosphate adenosyltransferase